MTKYFVSVVYLKQNVKKLVHTRQCQSTLLLTGTQVLHIYYSYCVSLTLLPSRSCGRVAKHASKHYTRLGWGVNSPHWSGFFI